MQKIKRHTQYDDKWKIWIHQKDKLESDQIPQKDF